MNKTNKSPVAVWQWAVALGFFGLVMLIVKMSPDVNKAPEAGVLMRLPDRVGDFVGGEQQGMTELEKKVMPADTEVARRMYTNNRGEVLATTIVLAGGQKNSIHRPEVCLPAQGWVIDFAEVVPVTLATGRALNVMKVEARLSRDESQRAFYLYWFVGKRVNTPSHWTRVFLSSWDRVFHNVNHRWAYVSVFMPVVPPRTGEQTLAIMKEFIANSAPEYMYSEMPAGRE